MTTISTYFFKDQPKQLFVGAELCARWYQLYAGSPGHATTERVVSYSREAQDMFSWILAEKALGSLVGRVFNKNFDRETLSTFSEFVSQAGSCGDIVRDKFFELPEPRFKVVGFAADTLGDALSLALAIGKDCSWSVAMEATKSIASVCLTLLSTGVYYGAQTYVMPRVSLILETTMFVAGFIHFSITYKPEPQKI